MTELHGPHTGNDEDTFAFQALHMKPRAQTGKMDTARKKKKVGEVASGAYQGEAGLELPLFHDREEK